jgi:hypothetical protein
MRGRIDSVNDRLRKQLGVLLRAETKKPPELKSGGLDQDNLTWLRL